MTDYVPGTEIEKPACRLTGQDGNSFAILGRVKQTLKRAGVSPEIQKMYMDKATSGDYDNLLRVSMDYVDVT